MQDTNEIEFNKTRTLIISAIGGIIVGGVSGFLIFFLFENLPIGLFTGFVLFCFLTYSIYNNSKKIIEKNK